MNGTMKRAVVLAVAAGIGLFALVAAAQQAADEKSGARDEKKAAESGTSGKKTAQQVQGELDEILRKRTQNPLIESEGTDPENATANGAKVKGGGKLRPEGQFIVMRRARMVRANAANATWMVTFEADKDGMNDPPMYLMPCRLLEDMERVAKQRGDEVVFVISGQIFLYQSNNYLLPTLMTVAPDRRNLK